MPTWRLEDARIRAAEGKYTFYRPGPAELSQVRVGETVKLIFLFERDEPKAPDAERMWVIVESIDGQGGFTGRLDNEPRWIKDLKAGDPIAFRDIHVINTEHDDHDNVVNRYFPRCFVTQRSLSGGEKVGYLYREDPDNDKDSGWRFVVGDESEDYMADSKNIALVSLGTVLNCDDSFVHLLDAPRGSAFERNVESGEFERVGAA